MEYTMLTGKVIRKHVAIIHAYSMMSALQRKIFNVLLHEALQSRNRVNSEHSVAVEYCISFANLSKAIHFNSNNKQYLKESIDDLASLKIEWNLLKDKVPTDISFLNLRVLHGSPTFYQDGTFNFSLHKVLLDLATNPFIYGTIDLDLQAQYESKYGHSLYENSTRFLHLNKSKIIQLDTFRKLLGVDSNKYPSMREFTRNVINPAVEEVNDRADFVVNLDTIRTGRKITAYELIVTPKKKTDVDGELEKNHVEKNEMLLKDLKHAFGKIGDTITHNIFMSYSEEYIAEKLQYTKKVAKKNADGLFPIAYFMSALKNDYKSPDQLVEQEQVKISKVQDDWVLSEQNIQREIHHWKRIYTISPTDTNRQILSNCEEKLRQHHLSRSSMSKEGC